MLSDGSSSAELEDDMLSDGSSSAELEDAEDDVPSGIPSDEELVAIMLSDEEPVT